MTTLDAVDAREGGGHRRRWHALRRHRDADDAVPEAGPRFIFRTVAALTVWNVGVAFVSGAIVYALCQRGWLEL
ncbi:MAG: hypothetical protein U1E63_11050 [Burkholderiales bacterium]